MTFFSQLSMPVRIGLCLIALVFLLVYVLPWLHSDAAVLTRVRATVAPQVDSERTLGWIFDHGTHARQTTWIQAWGDDRRCVAISLHVAAISEVDAALPTVLNTLRQEVAKNAKWVGLATDRPLTIVLVFRETGEGDAAHVDAFQVFVSEAWVEYKESDVDSYETSVEAAISASDDRGSARLYRLVHVGDKAFFNVGLTAPMLAGPGCEDPWPVVKKIADWK